MIDRIKSSTITQVVNGFERRLSMTPPYDRRHTDPSKNYGVHGVDLRLLLVKDKQAVQFVAYLPVYLPQTLDFWQGQAETVKTFLIKGMGADVGYHALAPQYEGQSSMANCDATGGACYYDGSGLRAEEWYQEWLVHGNDHIWTKLEEEYLMRFSEKKEMHS
jgi:hypothetical protein